MAIVLSGVPVSFFKIAVIFAILKTNGNLQVFKDSLKKNPQYNREKRQRASCTKSIPKAFKKIYFQKSVNQNSKLLIFLTYQNILLRRGHFYCTRPDTFCYNKQNKLNMGNIIIFMDLNQFMWWSCDTYGLKVRILYTQQNGSFVVEKTLMKFCKGCIWYELTLHLPREVHCYYFATS